MHPDEWKKIQKLGTLPGIDTPEKFAEAVERGRDRAFEQLAEMPDAANPGIETFKAVHRAIFAEVFPWAGHFRRPNQEHEVVAVKGSGTYTSRPEQVEKDLAVLQKDTAAALADERNPRAQCEEVGYHCMAVEAIKPFAWGSREVAQVFMETQMQRLPQATIVNEVDMDVYDKGMSKAVGRLDMKQFNDLVVDVAGQADRIRLAQIDKQLTDANDPAKAPTNAPSNDVSKDHSKKQSHDPSNDPSQDL